MPIELLPETPSQTAGPYVQSAWPWKRPATRPVTRKSGTAWRAAMRPASTSS